MLHLRWNRKIHFKRMNALRTGVDLDGGERKRALLTKANSSLSCAEFLDDEFNKDMICVERVWRY